MSPHFFQEWGKSFFQVSLYIRENKTLDLRPEPEVAWLGLRIEAVKGLQLGLVGPEVLKGVAVLPGRFLDVGVLWGRLQPMVGLKLVLRLALMMAGLKVGGPDGGSAARALAGGSSAAAFGSLGVGALVGPASGGPPALSGESCL